MRVSVSVAVIVLLGVLAGVSSPVVAQERVPVFPYVVQGGEGCGDIAQRFLGDRQKYPLLHKHNTLGPMPHNLRPGTVLMIPVLKRSADAWLSGVWGAVKSQSPSRKTWDSARRGMDLFRAWKVNSEESSSAELTFKDNTQLRMRENTIVIIYGSSRTKSRRMIQHAELETGGLRARLGELSGKPSEKASEAADPDAGNLQVLTPTGVAELDKGEALVTVDEKKSTRVANHGKKPVQVSSRRKRARPVEVAPDFGSKVEEGKNPTPPKPLPPVPTWQVSPRRFATVGASGVIKGQWVPVDKAQHYRLEIWRDSSEGREVVVSSTIPATPKPAFEVEEAVPGLYRVTVASIDGDKFESRPSEEQVFELLAAGVSPLGEDRTAAKAVEGDIWVGHAIHPPAGLKCGLDGGAPTDPIPLVRPGEHSMSCTSAEGAALPTFKIRIKAPEVVLVGQESGPLVLPRGAPKTLSFNISEGFDAELGISGPPGVTMTPLTLGADGTWRTEVTVSEDSPSPVSLAVFAGESDHKVELSRFDVAVEAMPVDEVDVLRLVLFGGFSRQPQPGTLRLEPAGDNGDIDVNALHLGLIGGVNLVEGVGLELDVHASFNLGRTIDPRHSAGARGQLVYEVIQGPAVPHLLIGGGAEFFFGGPLGLMGVGHTGIGSTFKLSPSLRLRLEGVAAFVFGSVPVTTRDTDEVDVAKQDEVSEEFFFFPMIEIRLGFDF